jgi:2-polyprenylphenol 6-hydroxylase
MSSPARFDVVVVGTGVAGLAAALGAAQLSLRTALIGPPSRRHVASEAAPFDQRIYALAPAAIAFLQRLKLWPSLDATRLAPVAKMRVFGDSGAELSFDAWRAALPELAVIAEESELLRVLNDACRYTPALERIDAQFLRQRQGDGAIEIDCADGRGISASVLVGADGAYSAVRAALGINTREHAYGQTAIVCNFDCAKPHQGVAYQWFDADGVIALLPLPGERVSLVWSAPKALAESLLAGSAADLDERLAQFAEEPLGALSPCGALASFPLRSLSVDRLIGQRTLLIGDAAHVVHPLAGQGLNLGLADVSEWLAVLAARESWRDAGDPVLLRRYERARAEPLMLMRWTTDGLARLFARTDSPTRELRNLGFSLVDRLTPLKNLLIRHAAQGGNPPRTSQ